MHAYIHTCTHTRTHLMCISIPQTHMHTLPTFDCARCHFAQDNAVVKLFSTSGNEFPPTAITVRLQNDDCEITPDRHIFEYIVCASMNFLIWLVESHQTRNFSGL